VFAKCSEGASEPVVAVNTKQRPLIRSPFRFHRPDPGVRLMISSVIPAQLELDDLKMREWRELLRTDIGLSEKASDHVATTIYSDIVASDPADIFSLADAISCRAL